MPRGMCVSFRNPDVVMVTVKMNLSPVLSMFPCTPEKRVPVEGELSGVCPLCCDIDRVPPFKGSQASVHILGEVPTPLKMVALLRGRKDE